MNNEGCKDNVADDVSVRECGHGDYTELGAEGNYSDQGDYDEDNGGDDYHKIIVMMQVFREVEGCC